MHASSCHDPYGCWCGLGLLLVVCWQVSLVVRRSGLQFWQNRGSGATVCVVAWSGARGIGVGRGFARELSVVGKVGCGGCMI